MQEIEVKKEKPMLQKVLDMPISEALQSNELKTIVGNIMYGSIEGKEKDINKYISGILNTVRNNKDLLSCSVQSVVLSILTSANLKLPVDARHYSYLVPYKDKKTNEKKCSFIVGYQAYLYYAKKDPEVDNIEPFIVVEGDSFEYFSDEKGNHFTFKPDYTINRTEAKKLFGVAVLRYKEGTGRQPQIVIMSYEEIKKVIPTYFNKETKKFERTKFWTDDEDEMIKKTVVKRLGKWFLKDVDFEALNMIDNAQYEGKKAYYDENGNLIIQEAEDKSKQDIPDIKDLENVVPLD